MSEAASSAETDVPTEVTDEPTEVSTEAQLDGHNGRLLVQLNGRHVALIAHGRDVHAIDATCYHMGGPLLHADIEDYGESFGPCVVCPWHRYPISLRTGDSLYRNMSGTVCSKGRKQRVHEVERRDGKILVRLATTESKIESDTYAFKPPPPSSGGQQGAPPPRSGQVLRAGAAGLRRPLPAAGAGDVAKSMCGADGRAPWARSAPPPPPPPSGFGLGARRPAGCGVCGASSEPSGTPSSGSAAEGAPALAAAPAADEGEP